MVKKHLHGIIIFHGMKQNITLTTIEVGKQLNQTTTRKPKQSIIGTAQLGCPSRRLKWPDLMVDLLVKET